jgi:nitric oxide reductase NorD protein
MPKRSLTFDELEGHLEEYLDPVLSTRRTAETPAQALSQFSRQQQDFILHWVSVIVRTNSEMGYQFASHAPEALRLMDLGGVENWIIQFMDVYDKQGLYPGCSTVQAVAQFARDLRRREFGLNFEEVARILEHFVQGLAGRELKLQANEIVHTDTEHLYLPPRLIVFRRRQQNFGLYKAMASHLWSQTWFGTFRVPGEQVSLTAVCGSYADTERAVLLFHALETVRLNACIERELPGLYREMMALQREQAEMSYPSSWTDAVNRLKAPETTVRDTIHALRLLYPAEDRLPPPFCFQGRLMLESTEAAMRDRQRREQHKFQDSLRHINRKFEDHTASGERSSTPHRIQAICPPSQDRQHDLQIEWTVDGRPLSPPEELRTLSRSIVQDFGEIPDEYLVAAGDGAYPPMPGTGQQPANVWEGAYHEEGAWLYNEWDFRRQHYRKDWCVLREIELHPSEERYVDEVLRRYAGLISGLRKTFEALRGEDRILKKQIYGDDIDLDAVVEAYADMHVGLEMSEQLFTKHRTLERNMAVIFMVDMSGSTKGWINDAEREALVLLCEALEILGDRYAIYGFSGMTRKRCELYRIKRFDEHYGDQVKRRIAGIRPQDYTRMGVIIRHLTGLLADVEARTKLLITLSDGKPDDYDGYRGEYGIEDTRQALIEAKHQGIYPFCITIDTEAHDYLPRMYGAVNYVVIDEVRKLPLKVSDIYRHLTT